MKCLVKFDQSEYRYPWYGGTMRKRLADVLATQGIEFNPGWEIVKSGEKEDKVCPNGDFTSREHLMDILELAKAGLQFTVVEADAKIQSTLIGQIANKLAQLPSNTASPSQNITVNIEQAQDAFLHKVSDVKICEDYCTDELRERLKEGWRILAVCYQKGNRRPDYVMGRYE